MTGEDLIEQIVSAVIYEIESIKKSTLTPDPQEEDALPEDIVSSGAKAKIYVEQTCDEVALHHMKKTTTARIGIGKAGPRLKTKTLLALRADHAIARDAVSDDVSDDLLKEMGLFKIQTSCASKNEFLTRPDKGRCFLYGELQKLEGSVAKHADVLIYASDGLSSKAVESNISDILPTLFEGLKAKSLSTTKPFFVKYGRVGAMDSISEYFHPKVICVLIGERPGLRTAKSMSAYIAYNATVGMEESRRTVISNIHPEGTNAVEAGAYLSEVIEKILKAQKSGIALSEQEVER